MVDETFGPGATSKEYMLGKSELPIKFDPLAVFATAVETFKQSGIVIPGEPDRPSAEEPVPPNPEDQIQQDVQASIVELDSDLKRRLREYDTCQARGHQGTYANSMLPEYKLCEFCGTNFRERVVYDEVMTPAETAEMLKQMKEAQVVQV